MNSFTVLIVDDDQIIREQVDKELQRNFFKTVQASTGKAALEIFQKEVIDILLLDVKLPDMDGLSVLTQVKEKKPDCEVIVMTGFGGADIAVQALKRGAIDYLEKPLKLDDIKTALGRAQEKITSKAKLSFHETLLVIDDDPDQVERLKKILGKEGLPFLPQIAEKRGSILSRRAKLTLSSLI